MEVYVARQPIFDKRKKVFGYELLYRSGTENYYNHYDGDQATSNVITNSFSIIGIDVLTGGKKAFVNFTHNLLRNEMVTVLPPDKVAVEILEDIEPDDETIEICKNLKKMGYTLVLDDFVTVNQISPLVDIADIIKVDFLKSSVEERKLLVEKIGLDRIKFLAEKVETEADFEEALKMGYSYFQGFFFSKPDIFSGQDLPAYKLNYLRIIREVNQPEIEFNELEEIIKQDIAISYKLLRLINSAAFGLNTKITSIKYALVLLGIKEFVKWVTLIALRGIGEDKPDELIISSLIRAKFAENLAPVMGLKDESPDLFLMGMFSMIDAMLDRPLDEIMTELPISQKIKDALLGIENNYKDIFDLILSFERANWEKLVQHIEAMGLTEREIAPLYFDSLRWVKQIFE